MCPRCEPRTGQPGRYCVRQRNDATILGFSPDGRYAYIGEDTGRGVHHRVLDLAKGRLGDGRAISQGHAYYVQ